MTLLLKNLARASQAAADLSYRRTIVTAALRLACAAAFLLWICAASPIRAQSQSPAAPGSITLAQYESILARVQGDSAAAASSQGDSAREQRAMSDVAPILHVAVLAPGADIDTPTLIYADNGSLLAAMQAANLAPATDDVSAGQARAAQWHIVAGDVAQIRAALPTGGQSVPNAAASARQVLAGADFASEPVPPESIWERMGDAIQRWLDHLHFPHGHAAPMPVVPVTRVVPEIILIVIGVAAVGLIVYFTTILVRSSIDRRASQERVAQLDLAFTAEEKELVAAHNYARLRALADEAARSGDYRAAYRLIFLATLVYLDSEGAIRLDRAKTNWEYLRALSQAPSAASGGSLQDLLRPVVREFDRIWYGQRPASQREYDAAAEAYASVQSRIDGDRAASAGANASGNLAAKPGARAGAR